MENMSNTAPAPKKSLFDEMLSDEEYRKLFDALPDDEKPLLMNSVRKFVDDFEKSLEVITENIDRRT